MADLIYPVKDRLRSRRAVTKTSYYPLEGGLDIVTPALSIPPGRAIGMVNFEPWYQGGYRRIPGYERFDGRPKPSDALFDGFDVDDIAGLTLRDVITGDTSGATGVLCGIYDDSAAGGVFGSDTIGVTKVVGTFVDTETCNVGAFTIESDPISLYAPDVDTEETFLLEAENVYRDDILEVPGAGQSSGVWQRLADIYAIRDNVGVTAGILHKATTSGWDTAPITMAETIRFDAALAAGQDVVEGDTLTGGSSGATGTIHRIVLNGGSNAYDGSGEGYYVLTGVAGGPFTDNEALESPALTQVADADGVNSTFAFSPGGVYQFINHNYFASSATYRVYGCNGVDPAFEIDNADIVSPILMPINPATGDPPTNNTPFLIEEHRNHLFLAFEGGSAQHSVVGEPLVWSGFLGAAEFGLGDELTGMNSVVGNVLVLSTTRETRGLYGTSSSDWELRIVAEQSGSLLFGSQKIDTVYSLDDLGITSVARSDQYGDFISATVSQQVQPLVTAQRPRFTDSSIVRESNQFRLYFDDNSFLIMYIPAGTQTETQVRRRTAKSPAEFGFGSYDFTVAMIYNSDDETGKERTYFVTTDPINEGFVFEDQIGKNFDGEEISSYLRTAFNHLGTPTLRKRFRRADLELNAPQTLSLQFSEDLSYSTAEVSSGITDLETVDIAEVDIFGGGGFWNDVNWDDFLWDGTAIATARADLSGTGENVSFLIFNESAKAAAWEMQGITVHYDRRRLQR
jgi:hypothetical protein